MPLSASDRLKPILSQLSRAIILAVNTARARRGILLHVLRDLTKFESRPWCLTEMAYEWCSVICQNKGAAGLQDEKELLLLSLEIGFRHLDPQSPRIILTHTKHHQQLVDIAFESGKSESIADFLHAWTSRDDSSGGPCTSLGMCTRHLVDLHQRMDFSPRLRRLVIRSIRLIGYREFKKVGVEKFVKLLNYLQVGVEVMEGAQWARFLLDAIQSPEGARLLSLQSWERLVEFVIAGSPGVDRDTTYNPEITKSLEDAQEWDRLECWIAVAWMLWSESVKTAEDLERGTVSLFRQRPSATQKLGQWMERWSAEDQKDVPKTFQRICDQIQETTEQLSP